MKDFVKKPALIHGAEDRYFLLCRQMEMIKHRRTNHLVTTEIEYKITINETDTTTIKKAIPMNRDWVSVGQVQLNRLIKKYMGSLRCFKCVISMRGVEGLEVFCFFEG